MTRDQTVTTCRLGDAHGDAGHVVLIVDVDPAGLDLAGRRLLAAVREAVAAWEAAEAASDSRPRDTHFLTRSGQRTQPSSDRAARSLPKSR